jgi:hypothetical protein
MKKSILWILAILITVGTAYYQRKTGPTYPKAVNVTVNDSTREIRLVRSLGLDERPEVKLNVDDTSIQARLFYKRYKTGDDYSSSEFRYKVYPVSSFLMNKVFGINEERGFFAEVPQQPPAGKLQYYIELTDSDGTTTLMKETPVVIRFKGAVPSYILTPHILLMFLAMLFSTVAGLMALAKNPLFRKYSLWTLIILIVGGIILGPVVQKYAFGEFWTGIPFGWDLTDNKTLIASLFWILAVTMNRKKERPLYSILAAVVLLVIFSIPHSVFGSELDYSSGQVTQGLILIFSDKILNNS